MYMHHRHRAGMTGGPELFAVRIVAVRVLSRGYRLYRAGFGVALAEMAVALPQQGAGRHGKYASGMDAMANMILLTN
jgi:hypothetical protein